jgi:hypothetical protein
VFTVYLATVYCSRRAAAAKMDEKVASECPVCFEENGEHADFCEHEHRDGHCAARGASSGGGDGDGDAVATAPQAPAPAQNTNNNNGDSGAAARAGPGRPHSSSSSDHGSDTAAAAVAVAGSLLAFTLFKRSARYFSTSLARPSLVVIMPRPPSRISMPPAAARTSHLGPALVGFSCRRRRTH